MIEIIPNWHPIFVHFSVALLSTSALLFLLAVVLGKAAWRSQWLHAASWNLWIGAGVTIATVLAGWYAFTTVAHDAVSHRVMEVHRNWAIATLVAFLGLALWRWLRRGRERGLGAFVSAMLVGVGLLAVTAWYGAELVYRHGLGVMSLPDAEEAHHDHGHDERSGDAGEQ